MCACEPNRKCIMDRILQWLQKTANTCTYNTDTHMCTHVVGQITPNHCICCVAVFTELRWWCILSFFLPFFLTLCPVSHWLSRLARSPPQSTHTHTLDTQAHMNAQTHPPTYTKTRTTCTLSLFFSPVRTNTHICTHMYPQHHIYAHMHTHSGGHEVPSRGRFWLTKHFMTLKWLYCLPT